MTKRRKFIITSLLLSLGFVGINFLSGELKFWAIGALTAITIALFVWSLFESLDINAALLTLVLPALYTLGVGLFWFLLPSTIFAKIPVVILYGVGIYALCLTINIYTVSTIRTIALMRAAKGVGFLLSLITFFLLFDAIFSLRSHIWISVPLTALASFPLFLQGLWASTLDTKIDKKLLSLSLVSTLGITQVATALYFWPVTVVVGSLFLTITAYMLLGLGQAKLEGRLFKTTVSEYLTVGVVVFIAVIFATRWAG